MRYEAISRPELIEDGAPFAIEIAINPDAKTLTFSDNGVGMTAKTDPRPRHHRPFRHQGFPEQARRR